MKIVAKKYELSDFGFQAKIALLKHGMTQTELAKKLGISSAYLSDILRGARKSSDIEKAICEILEIEQEEGVG